MLDTMSKKRPATGGAGKGEPDRHTNPKFAFYIRQELLDSLERYCQAQRIIPDKSEVMRVILREFLEREGFWPPEGKG